MVKITYDRYLSKPKNYYVMIDYKVKFELRYKKDTIRLVNFLNRYYKLKDCGIKED